MKLLVLSIATASSQLFAQEEPKPVEIVGDRFTVALAERSAGKWDEYQNLHFKVLDGDTGSEKWVVIRDAEILDLAPDVRLDFVPGEQLLITIRHLKGPIGTARLYRLDLTTALIVDDFFGILPEVSPSGRYVAFKMFWGRQWVPGLSEVVLVYDNLRSPAENRLPSSNFEDGRIGIPVYPERNAQAKQYVFFPEQRDWPDEMLYHIQSPFLWAEDETELVFLSRREKQTFICEVFLTDGIDNVDILEAPVRLTKDQAPPGRERAFEDDARKYAADRMVYAHTIKWHGSSEIVITNKFGSLADHPIRLKLPRARSEAKPTGQR